jgi:hypothetical protein
MTRTAVLLPLLLALALGLVAGCGGSDDEASSSTDVNELLEQTFTGSKKVESGNLDLALEIEAEGGESQLNGPVTLTLSGPFQAQDEGKLPEFSLEAAFKGGGQTFNAGATSTGEKGYVSFQGTDYVVDDQVFEQFKAGFEQAQQQGEKDQQSFASLGMDPRKWLTDPKNEGDAKVGDDDTIKITGGIDVSALLDDVNNALEQASSLGLGGAAGEVPERITEQQKRQVTEAVKDPRVEIYTGKEDKILRRMVVDLGVDDKASGTSGTVAFDVSIADLNEDQDIAEPADAKPFDELVGQLGGLGLGGAGLQGGGSGSSGSGSGSGGGSADDFEKFSKCIEDAGNDTEKARECADLLSG